MGFIRVTLPRVAEYLEPFVKALRKDAVFEDNVKNRAAFERLKNYVATSCRELEILR